MKKSTLIQVGIGLILLCLLILSIGSESIVHVINESDLYWLLLSFLFSLFGYLINSIKLYVLFYAITKKISFFKFSKNYMLSVSIGTISPSRIGDLSLGYFLNKEGLSKTKGISITMIDKLLNVFIMIIIAIITVYYFLEKKYFYSIVSFFVAVSSILFLIAKFKKSIVFFKKLIPYKFYKILKSFINTFNEFFLFFKFSIFLNVFLSFLRYVIASISFLLLFYSFNYNITFLEVFSINSIALLVALIPITFSGLGLLEASATYLFYQLAGVDLVVCLSVMLINRMKLILLSIIFFILNKKLI